MAIPGYAQRLRADRRGNVFLDFISTAAIVGGVAAVVLAAFSHQLRPLYERLVAALS